MNVVLQKPVLIEKPSQHSKTAAGSKSKPSQPKPIQKPVVTNRSSWFKTFGKVGLSAVAAAFVSHIVYKNHFSPTRFNHDLQDSALSAYFEQYVNGCNSTAFRSLQKVTNIFETSHHFASLLGIKSKQPPGDIQAFLFDQNFEALDCAVNSYPEDYFTFEMKNKLLGRVLEQIEVNHKDLARAEQWLLDQNATIHYQSVSQNQVLNPLLSAYRTLNPDLFESLIDQGARVDLNLVLPDQSVDNTYFQKPLIGCLIEEIKTSSQGLLKANQIAVEYLDEVYKCSAIKRIVDASLKQMSQLYYYSAEEADKLRVRTYMYLKDAVCPREFACTIQEKMEYHEDQGYAKVKAATEIIQEFAEWLEKAQLVNQDFEVPADESLWHEVKESVIEGLAQGADFLRNNVVVDSVNGVADQASEGLKVFEYASRAFADSRVQTAIQEAYELEEAIKRETMRTTYMVFENVILPSRQFAADATTSAFTGAYTHVFKPGAEVARGAIVDTARGTYNYVILPSGQFAVGATTSAITGTYTYAVKPGLWWTGRAIAGTASGTYNHLPSTQSIAGTLTGAYTHLEPGLLWTGGAIAGTYTHALKPGLMWTGGAIAGTYTHALKPGLMWTGGAIAGTYTHALKPGLMWTGGAIAGTYTHVLKPGLLLTGGAAGLTYSYGLKPAFNLGMETVSGTGTLLTAVKDNVVKPTIEAVGDVGEAARDVLSDARAKRRTNVGDNVDKPTFPAVGDAARNALE